MRTFLCCALMLSAALLNTGCFMPIYSASPDIRVREQVYTSEGLRHVPEIWERTWALEMPDLATPYRTHGGVI
jgi:hypothetical protein